MEINISIRNIQNADDVPAALLALSGGSTTTRTQAQHPQGRWRTAPSQQAAARRSPILLLLPDNSTPCRKSMMSMLSIPRHSRQTCALVLAVFELHWTQKRLDQRCDPGLVLRFNNLLDNTQAAQCHQGQGPSTFRGPRKLEPEILCRSHDHHPRKIPDHQAPEQQDADPLLLPQDPGLLPTHQGLLHLQQDPDPLQQCQGGRLRFAPSSGLFSFGAENRGIVKNLLRGERYIKMPRHADAVSFVLQAIQDNLHVLELFNYVPESVAGATQQCS